LTSSRLRFSGAATVRYELAVRRGFRAATGRPSPAANAAPRFSGAELPPYASRLCAAVKSGETPQVMGHGVLLSLRRGLAYLPAHSSRDG